MDVTILNTDLDAVAIVDTYESFFWTDRYYAYGDFELYEAIADCPALRLVCVTLR